MRHFAGPFHPRARAALIVIAVAASAGISAPALAQTVTCGVGDRIESDLQNSPGTIAEVGTERPHVGWYRVVYEWNKPNGDWYDPRSWPFSPVGSKSRCTAPGQAPSGTSGAAPSRPATPAPSSPGARTPPKAQPAPPSPSAPPPSATGNGRLDTGTYTCSAPGAGFFRIEIRDGSKYVDRAGQTGSYSIDAATGIITFGSGSLAGQHSKLLKPGKFGLASSPTKQFYTVCNLKR